jgi:phenylacetate-CoA ligase
MNVGEIHDKASNSSLLSDPYVKKVRELIGRNDLFEKSPDALERMRKGLLRDALSFFAKRNDQFARILDTCDITPSTAEFSDLAKLAIPSDMLRGEGQKPFLIDGLDEGGETYTSSGTTGKSPVKIYRSPLDLDIMMKANTDLFEYVYGDTLEQGEGTALFMAAPELRDRLYFIASVHLTLENQGLDLVYGMDMVESDDPSQPWMRLEPNRDNIVKFLKAKSEPKLFFTAPAGIHLMSQRFETMNFLRRLVYKLATGSPPVKLGKGGVIVTGGGNKGASDLPPYETIVHAARKHYRAHDRSGRDVTVPFMDVLGMTETLTALIDNFGTMGKVPHPLSHVFLLDPKTMEVIEEDGREGILGIFNPFVTSWPEIFYPGDIMTSAPSDRYYGKEFSYMRRLRVEEGWDLQRACGGTMEELMDGPG